MGKRYLLDVNVLIALTSDEHEHYQKAHEWLSSVQHEEWGICPLTEAGYVRFAANPARSPQTISFSEATAVLGELGKLPGYGYWSITKSWRELTAPFAQRIFGHQQVTDAFLLGLAIKEDGALVTFDRGLRYLAGPEFSRNLLLLD